MFSNVISWVSDIWEMIDNSQYTKRIDISLQTSKYHFIYSALLIMAHGTFFFLDFYIISMTYFNFKYDIALNLDF